MKSDPSVAESVQRPAHTPGPWHWDCDDVKNDPLGRVRYRVVTTGKTITQVYYSSREGGLTNAVADARLIAAAPDLLEALQEMIPLIGCHAHEVSIHGDTAKARAAIAKATGAGNEREASTRSDAFK